MTRGAVLSVLATVVVLDNVYVEKFYSRLTNEHFRQATRMALEWIEEEPGTELVVFSYPNRFGYYLGMFGYRGKVAFNTSRDNRLIEAVEKQFERGAPRVLLLAGHKEASGPLETLRRRFSVAEHREFPGASTTLLESRGAKSRLGKPRGRGAKRVKNSR